MAKSSRQFYAKLREKYKKRSVSSAITSAKVDKKLLQQRLSQGYDDKDVLQELYTRYNLTYFSDKDTFVNVMLNTKWYDIPSQEMDIFTNTKNKIRLNVIDKVRREVGNLNTIRSAHGEPRISDKAIDDRIMSELLLRAPHYEKALYDVEKRWAQYQKREQLIITGQYANIRAGIYRNNYVQALENNNVPRRLINAIKRMDIEDWIRLSGEPDPDTNTSNKYRLPVISFFYAQSDAQQRTYYNEITEQLEKLLIEKGLLANEREASAKDIAKYGSKEVYSAYRELIRKSVDDVDRYLTRVPISARRNIKISDSTLTISGERYNMRDTENIKMALLDYRVKSLGFEIKTSKAGNPYIPFTSSRDARMLKEWRAKHK